MKEDIFGNYLFLDVLQGKEEICCIHQVLYDNEFKEFDLGLSYLPHMTIGKLSTMQLLKNAYNDVKTMDNTFHTIVDTISVEMIGNNEESVIVIEKELI